MSRPSLLARIRRRLDGPGAPLPPSAWARPLLRLQGVCPVCERQTTFVAYQPWLREALLCSRCGSVPRERAVAAVLEQVRPDWRNAALHESSPSDSPGSRRLRRECAGYVATQYDPSTPAGRIAAAGHRSEDLERQTFADATFDVVLTQDVFEHLFRPDLAIREIARTLKPGGVHLCTVPLVRGDQPTRRRAERDPNGVVVHLLPPEHHANPMSAEGSLVTLDWGHDIAEHFQTHGGLETLIHTLHDPARGIVGELNEVIVARKPGGPAA